MRKLSAIVAVLLAAGGGGAYLAARRAAAPGPLAENLELVVPRGNLDAVSEALRGAGVIDSALLFRAAALATWEEGNVRAGEFAFPRHASLLTVLRVLRTSRPVQHRVTIAEGLTAAQISRILAAAPVLQGDADVPREGALLPDTYSFVRGTDIGMLEARAQAAMARTLTAAWAGRDRDLPLRAPRDALILASMVEREAKLPAERPMIARVFLNRLTAGMRLQSDPTTIYGASGGLGTLGRPITHDDLAADDPYNTYVRDGLPAGPICSPGIAAIQAVLHPSSGDALYFVADGAGGHMFANSLAGHNANVSYGRARGGRGRK